MKYRTLGKTDWKVSAIALGGAALMSRLGRKESERAIRTALESGINLFDTAPLYGRGESEKLLARLTSSQRDRIFIMTKVGKVVPRYISCLNIVKPLVRGFLNLAGRGALHRVGGVGTGLTQDQKFDANSMMESVESSLRRMRTEQIDALLLHSPSPETLAAGQFISVWERLRQEGKVLYFGVALEDSRGFDLLLELPPHLLNIVQFPLTDVHSHQPTIAQLYERGVGLIGRSPFRAKPVAADYSTTLEEMLRLPLLSSVLIGMTQPANIMKNCQVCDRVDSKLTREIA